MTLIARLVLNQKHRSKGSVKGARLLLAMFCLLASQSWAAEPGVIPGTIKNFMDYFNEALEEARADGAQGPVLWPQWQYDPGLGPVNVLPEFSNDLGLAFTPLYLLDMPSIPFELRLNRSQPQIPAINRQVVGITETDGFKDPHIPPLRWTADGRIGVESQVGGSLESPSPVKMYLFAPEKLTQPFVDSPSGPRALVLDKVELPFAKLAQGRTGSIQHTNICDPYIRAEGERHNPYSCGVDGRDDCYDVTLISAYVRLSNVPSGDNIPAKLDAWDRVMGTPLHIRVENPKTSNARIAEVSYGETRFSPKRTGVLFETITPADGRLFIARRGFLPLVWKNQATGQMQAGSYDVVYAVSPPDADPCDVQYWSDLYPITHAPYDDRVNTRYGFAMQPFRDPSGAVIPDGVDIKGTYPWMDKEAKNFSIQVSPAKLFPSYGYDKNPQSRYPVRCVDQQNCSIEHMQDTDNSKDNMFMLIGLWTQGKMVLLDGLLNDIDFRLGGNDRFQSYLSLYQPGTGNNPNDRGEVRVGATRGGSFDFPVWDEAGNLVGHYNPANLSMLDSIENRLNYLPNLKPSRFQDVVWTMSSGHSTVEFSFDDYLNPDGFIVSNMVAHTQHQSGNWYRMKYFDGWHQLTRSFNGQVRIQNSATALPDRWRIPEYGRVYHGRLEPVANGGIRGKGLWFDGSTRIDYKIPQQPQSVHEHDWFYSLFIDPRFDDDEKQRVLIRFPDRSQLTLRGRNQLILSNSRKEVVTEVDLPQVLPEKGWTHLALLVKARQHTQSQQVLEVFINGYHHHTFVGDLFDGVIEADNFRPTPGILRVGKGSSLGGARPFEGWLDEFKVFAYEPNIESICNFAHGTLMGVPSDYQGSWRTIADQYGTESHDHVSSELNAYGMPLFARYVCYHDYSGDHKAHLFNLPQGLVRLREALHFPEGPLYHDAPRPDSRANEFCTSCHHEGGPGGLSLRALQLDTGLNASDDPRRQPTQPPARVYGNIPANWFPGSPEYEFDSGPDGVPVDQWLMPSAQGVGPLIHNLAVADAEGHPLQGLGPTSTLSASALPQESTQLRANVNGLVRMVRFYINGHEFFDDEAPFTVRFDALVAGTNEVTVDALDEQGVQVSQSFVLVLEP